VETVIDIENIVTKFGSQVVHNGVSFRVGQGEVVAIIGGSGCGKSTLLREIIRLLRPTSGEIWLLGENVWRCSPEKMNKLRRSFGVLFQNGALFSALTVGENIALPFLEQTTIDHSLIDDLVQLRLGLSGLEASVAGKLPSELSGGMRKRAALARALALEPRILFLDEPTSGLDPVNARAFDQLIRTLSDSLGLTIFMVTHDLDTLEGIVDRIVVLGQGSVVANGSYQEVVQTDDPWIQEYFSARYQN
jgi:phospholipid/cholesterol/gamma-HCH transport system ATP-binding protein